MNKEELEKEAEEYTKNLLKKLGIKEDMLLENQPRYLRQESMNFVALDVENVTDAYLAGAEPREKQIAELEEAKANLEYLLEGKDNEIDELKKENKDLAQNLEDTEILNKTLVNRNAELKELLKQWLQTSKASGCDNINIVTDTEQFLKECK